MAWAVDFARRVREPAWLNWGAVGLSLAYLLIFIQTLQGSPTSAAASALANVLPAWALGHLVRQGVRSGLAALPASRQVAIHIPIGLAFTAVWYLLLNLALSISAVPERGAFVMTVLTGPALYWQAYQGLLLYGLIAAVATLEVKVALWAEPPQVVKRIDDGGISSILVRVGEQMRPVSIEDIILVRGADDYCEVWTGPSQRYLARTTLKGLTDRLADRRFVRIHKSWIVNLDHVVGVEPAGGGRMLVETTAGVTAPASRTGARLLRTLSV